MTSPDPYGDILAQDTIGGVGGTRRLADSYPSLVAKPDIPLLHRPTGLRGRLWKFTGELVVIVDTRGGQHTFENRPGSFAHHGETVNLVRPSARPAIEPGLRRSAAGALVSEDQSARTARASRLWVEGDHDARFMERVWGDELRELGIVVEPIGGIDDLVDRVSEFGPGAKRRLAVLVDHLVPGSKETRIVARVGDPGVLVVGHPFVDIWQCVRPRSLGIDLWPEVPRPESWKEGVCRRLGWGTVFDGWRRVLAAVNSFADLEPSLVGAVEQALDFLTEEDHP